MKHTFSSIVCLQLEISRICANSLELNCCRGNCNINTTFAAGKRGDSAPSWTRSRKRKPSPSIFRTTIPPAFSSATRILQGDDRLKMVKVIQFVAAAGLTLRKTACRLRAGRQVSQDFGPCRRVARFFRKQTHHDLSAPHPALASSTPSPPAIPLSPFLSIASRSTSFAGYFP